MKTTSWLVGVLMVALGMGMGVRVFGESPKEAGMVDTAPATTLAAAVTTAKNLVTVEGVTLIKMAEERGDDSIAGFWHEPAEDFAGDAIGSAEGILRGAGHRAGDGDCVFLHDVTFPEGKYHLSIRGKVRVFAALAASYAEAFHVKVTREVRELDVLVMEVDAEKIKALPVYTGDGGGWGTKSLGGTTGAKAEGGFDTLRAFVQETLNVPVVDETKDKGRYTVQFGWENKNVMGSMVKSLGELGIKLTVGKRKVEAVFVERMEEKGAKAGGGK